MAIGDLYNLTEAQTRDSGKPGAKICTHEKKKKNSWKYGVQHRKLRDYQTADKRNQHPFAPAYVLPTKPFSVLVSL